MKHWKSITVLTIVFLAIAIGFAPQFEVMGAWIVDRFGLPGLLLSTFLLDYLLQPFPPDIPLYSFILGGDGFWGVITLVALTSVVGGVCGYWTGRLLEYEGAIRFVGKKRYKQAVDLFHDHGVAAVVVAALSPVPFNVVCWSAGMFKMDFGKFLLSSIVSRMPRFYLVGLIALWVS